MLDECFTVSMTPVAGGGSIHDCRFIERRIRRLRGVDFAYDEMRQAGNGVKVLGYQFVGADLDSVVMFHIGHQFKDPGGIYNTLFEE
jgi:hypothetical protein